jgi:hypothetical protein
MSMKQQDFHDADDQAAWELIGRHESIEPSFGFAARTLRRLDEAPARLVWWQLPALRWAVGLSAMMVVAVSALHVQHVRQAKHAEVYAAVHQDSLEDYDVIASLDQL